MIINIKNIDINYIQYGKGKDIVLLHGWGQNIEMMKFLGDKLNNCRVTILDLPGFGSSSIPTSELNIYDYDEILEEFIKNLKIKNPIIIGHSFGGRIGIIYASKNSIDKLVLLGSPCVRKEIDESLKLKILKFMKRVPLVNKMEEVAKKHIGSEDYKKASPMMRKVLVNTVNEDLSDCAKYIDCPTLMIWGTNDTAAPIEDARELEKLIKDVGFIEYNGGSHYVYIERLDEVSNVINTFIRGE